MKKIININLSGRVIPIEDTAYEKLQAYIESLRRYFAHEDGRDEIINDIESRIAELMNDKVRKGAAAITDEDINEIAASMGRPEDFDAQEAEEEKQSSAASSTATAHTYTNDRREKKRLYRDSSDKFIGGVCSGIANYLNVDPAIVRILFAIITFGGFGLGFLIYIILWAILPSADLENNLNKRLYRNPDDKVFGGVAGGLAAYFGSRTSTARLIFAAPLLLSILTSILGNIGHWNHHDFEFFPGIVFGSLTGTFILAYVILWIVLPEARSTYEKMEMRGEKVDVNTIRQNMKDRMKEFGDEVKTSAQQFGSKAKDFANTTGKDFAREVKETARHSGRGIGHAIGVIFKAFFLFIVGTIAFALFVGVMALIFGGIAWWPVNNFIWTSQSQQLYAWGTLIFFLFVPLVGLILWLIRRIIGVKSRSSYLGWTFGLLWTLGWISVILFATSISKDFREYESVSSPIAIQQPANNRMVVVVSEPELEYTGRFGWMNDEVEGWDLSDDTLRLSTIRMNVKKSADDHYHVTLRKYGYGRTEQDAIRRAENIQYSVYSKDSVLDLGSGYSVDKTNKFRFQQVEVEIEVPAGKKINFDETVSEKLNPTNFKINRRSRHRVIINGEVITDYTENWFRFQSETDYVMGIDGKLRDPNGKILDKNDYNWENHTDYHQEKQTDSSTLKQQLEEQKRIHEESEKRIKELEQKAKQIKSSIGKINTKNNGDGFLASSRPMILSLDKVFF